MSMNKGWPHGPRKDTERKDNIVNGFNDVASRMRMLDARGMTIDFHAWSRLASSMTFVDFMLGGSMETPAVKTC